MNEWMDDGYTQKSIIVLIETYYLTQCCCCYFFKYTKKEWQLTKAENDQVSCPKSRNLLVVETSLDS